MVNLQYVKMLTLLLSKNKMPTMQFYLAYMGTISNSMQINSSYKLENEKSIKMPLTDIIVLVLFKLLLQLIQRYILTVRRSRI